MPTSYSFKCPNGHSFEAVAKIRARCPECGQTARRNFTSLISMDTTPKSKPIEKPIIPSTPSSIKEEAEEDGEISSKPPSSLKTERDKSPKLERPSVRVIRQGRVPSAKKPSIKKPISIVKKRVVHHSIPSITKMPVGSRQHKIDTPPDSGPYWARVKKAYFG